MKDGEEASGFDATLGATMGGLGPLSVGVDLHTRVDGGAGPEGLDGGPRYGSEEEELGRGGIGRVFAVVDERLGRQVAMKVLLADGLGSTGDSLSGVERRFVHEARITGQLEHPAIVPVHELGVRPDGSLYYTMKRVRGRTLAQAIRDAGTLERRLELLGHALDVCQALAYAHSRGVVHRDLKPSNVMVGDFGDTVVLDWGLAKVVGEVDPTDDVLSRALVVPSGERTLVGSALGTPAYMSPEQARGQVDRIDTRSDVWGLGAVLYEVVTGRAPHAGDAASAIERAQEGSVRPVVELEPGVPPELAAVVQKALSPDPAARYADAAGLAAELEAYLQGRRVRAFQYSTLDLAKRLVLRNRAVSAVSLLALVGAAVGGVALFDAWRVAEARAVEAAANEREAHAALSVAYAERATQLLDEDAAAEAAVFAAAAMVHSPFVPGAPWADPDRRDPATVARLRGLVADARDLRRVDHQGTYGPSGRRIRDVTTSFDGRYAAIQRGANIDVLDVETATIAHRVAIQASADYAMAWLATGELVVPSVDARDIQRIRPDGTVVSSFPHGLREHGLRMVSDIAASADGAVVAVRASGWIVVYDGGTGEEVTHFATIDMPGRPVISPDGSRLLLPGLQREAALFETRTGRVIRAWEERSIPTGGVFVGGRLLLATPEGVRVVDPVDGSDLPGGTSSSTPTISASPDGSTVLVQESRGPVLLDAGTFDTLAVLPRAENGQALLAELAGDEHLVLAELDVGGFVRTYRRRDAPPARFAPGVLPVSLRAAPDGSTVGVGDSSTALVLDARSNRVQARVDGVIGPYVLPWDGGRGVGITDSMFNLALLALDGDGRPVRTAAPARLTPGEVATLRLPGPGPDGGQTAVSVGGVVAFSRTPGPVVLWAGATGERIATLPRSEEAQQVAFSPDGSDVAVCVRSEVVVSPASPAAESGEGARAWALPGPCASVAWAPDGGRLVVAMADGSVRLLEADGTVSDARSFAAPLTVSWTRAGVLVEEADAMHVLDAAGRPVRTVHRRAPGGRHTLVQDGTSEALWLGEGRFVRRVDLTEPDTTDPAALLEDAQRRAGLVLSGFQLVQPRPEPPPPPDDPRALVGVAVTTDRGRVVHGTARLLDRSTWTPIGDPVPVRHDGSYVLVPPAGIDGEVAVKVEAAGFMPVISVGAHQRAGGRAVSLMLTRGGHDLVYALTGHERIPGTSGIALFAQHVDGGTPGPIGCAVWSSDPPLPFVYTAGSGDAALSSRPDTHPVDGQGTAFNVPPVPHRFTFTVGEVSASIDLPAVPADHVVMAYAATPGPDPTPAGCH